MLEKPLNFFKFEGTLNDFVVIDGRENPISHPEELSKKLLDRRASIGGDSLLYLEESKVADIKMRIFEKDGSESEMCGNGARCIGLYFDKFYQKQDILIETKAGIKKVIKVNENIFRVSMGKMKTLGKFVKNNANKTSMIHELFGLKLYIVNSSEPHAVIPVKSVKNIPKTKGIRIAKYFNLFPLGINVDFIEIMGSNEIKLRTVERGIYEETFACGTGAVASAFVLNKFFKGKNEVLVHARGGDLKVKITPSGNYLEGEARFVFKGVLEI